MFYKRFDFCYFFKYLGFVTSCYDHYSRVSLVFGLNTDNTFLKTGLPVFNSFGFFLGFILSFNSPSSAIFSSSLNSFTYNYLVFLRVSSYVFNSFSKYPISVGVSLF